jgi:hypothetical protein
VPVSGLRAATAARYREKAALQRAGGVGAEYYLRIAARWESAQPIEHCYGWQLASEFCPPGARPEEFSVGPAGELVRVRRVYPAPGEVRFAPVGQDPHWGVDLR